MATPEEIAIQLSALTLPITGLSLPSVEIRGQVVSHPDNRQSPTYNNNVDSTSGPFLLASASNIALFTDIFNNHLTENVINGVEIDPSNRDPATDPTPLENFLHAVLGTTISEEVNAICIKLGLNYSADTSQPGMTYAGSWDMLIPEESQGDVLARISPLPLALFRYRLHPGTGKPLGGGGRIENIASRAGEWFLLSDLIFAITNPPGRDPVTKAPLFNPLPVSTVCTNAPDSATKVYHTFTDSRTLHKVPLKLTAPIDGVGGIDSNNPPSSIITAFSNSSGLFGDIIDKVFVTASDAANYNGSGVDVRVNRESVVSGVGDASKMLSVTNVEKHKFDDDTVQSGEKATRILPALNLLERKANKGIFDASTVELSVWKEGVGDWRLSQVDDEDIKAQLEAKGLGGAGFQALKRLNLIPVLSSDKTLTDTLSTNADGEEVTVQLLNNASQVNLLESTWTIWKSLTSLNTETFGISATNVPGLTATELVPALSGNLRENLNYIYNTLSACCSGETLSPTDLSALKVGLFGDSLTDTLIDPLSSYSIVTNLNNLYTNIGTLSSDLQNYTVPGVLTTESPEITALSGCCETNSSELSALSATVLNLTNITSLSSLIISLTGIDATTIIQDLSGIKEDLSDFIDFGTRLSDVEYTSYINTGEVRVTSTDIAALSAYIGNLKFDTLSGLKDVFDGIDLNTYITKLSAVELAITNLSELSAYTTTIALNEYSITNILLDVEYLTSLYTTVSGLTGLETIMPTLTGIIENATNITNIQTLIDYLSAGTKFQELEQCCWENGINIDSLSGDVITNTTGIAGLSAVLDSFPVSLTGVVKTTGTQHVSGAKTFKSPLIVNNTSQFDDVVTIGNPLESKIFDVSSTNGVTTINVQGLPLSPANPGDLYIYTDSSGAKLLAVSP